MELQIIGEPLFLPRIAAHVIPLPLPKTRLVVLVERQAVTPFGTLPEIQVRNQQSRRSPVLGRQTAPPVHGRDHSLPGYQVCGRDIGGVAPVALG